MVAILFWSVVDVMLAEIELMLAEHKSPQPHPTQAHSHTTAYPCSHTTFSSTSIQRIKTYSSDP
jgi:hypothetical protein